MKFAIYTIFSCLLLLRVGLCAPSEQLSDTKAKEVVPKELAIQMNKACDILNENKLRNLAPLMHPKKDEAHRRHVLQLEEREAIYRGAGLRWVLSYVSYINDATWNSYYYADSADTRTRPKTPFVCTWKFVDGKWILSSFSM